MSTEEIISDWFGDLQINIYYSSKMYKTGWNSTGATNTFAQVGGSEKPRSTEHIKGRVSLQQREQHVFDIPLWCLKSPETFDSQTLMCQSYGDNSTERTAQGVSNPQFIDPLQTVVNSLLSSDEDAFCETYSELPWQNVPLHEHFLLEHDNKLAGQDGSAQVGRRPTDSSQRNKAEVACVTCGNSASTTVSTGKKRIKWTKDLHERFVAVVNSLGGSRKAKPKAILQMMDSKSLTIFHVKSHLQKYRTTRYMQNTVEEIYEERQATDMFNELLNKIHLHIEESRQLQLELRRSIQEQLEIQRNLLTLVEQQKK